MPIPASPVPLRAAGEGFQPRDLAGLALLCARSWGVPRAAVMERLERTDWEEAEHRLSGTDAWKRPWPPVWIAPSCRDTRNTETAGPSRSRRAGPRAFSGLPCTEDWIWISDP